MHGRDPGASLASGYLLSDLVHPVDMSTAELNRHGSDRGRSVVGQQPWPCGRAEDAAFALKAV